MKRGIPISTAGTQVAWAVETTAGTMPITAKMIPDIKSIPDMNPQPENLETTDLSCKEYKTFIPGLKDLSSANSFGANLTKLLISEWGKMMTAFENAKKEGKATWFFIKTPNVPTVAFTGEPSPLGVSGKEVNAVNATNCYITVTGEPRYLDESEEITITEPTGE